jgi:hypothetical protein
VADNVSTRLASLSVNSSRKPLRLRTQVSMIASAYTYAGYQTAFAFFLCVVQGSAPSFDFVTARDRIIGILIGNLAVYVLLTSRGCCVVL